LAARCLGLLPSDGEHWPQLSPRFATPMSECFFYNNSASRQCIWYTTCLAFHTQVSSSSLHSASVHLAVVIFRICLLFFWCTTGVHPWDPCLEKANLGASSLISNSTFSHTVMCCSGGGRGRGVSM